MNLGLTVDYCDIDDNPPEKLFAYGVIEFLGGNPFYLLKSMRKSGCHNIMRKLENNCKILRIDDGQGVFVGEVGYKLI